LNSAPCQDDAAARPALSTNKYGSGGWDSTTDFHVKTKEIALIYAGKH
jgi:hypothetical protein